MDSQINSSTPLTSSVKNTTKLYISTPKTSSVFGYGAAAKAWSGTKSSSKIIY